MSSRLRFLLSGPGLIGRQHAKLLIAHPDCSLSAIAAPPRDRNKTFALECGAAFFSTFDEALESGAFDAVIISPPNSFHYDQAAACIRKGLPVFVEKPITDGLDSARRLVDLSERAEVPVLVGHHRTYSPLLDSARAFLASTRFGRPVALQGSALFYKPAQYFKEGAWRTKKGGGPILINLIHEIGLMRLFFGEIDSVFAMPSHSVRGFEVEDTAAIALNFTNGALGTFILSDTAASSKSWEMTAGENPAYPHFPEDACYHFAGTNGSLDFPSMRVRYYRNPAEASWWAPFESAQLPLSRANPLERQLDHFVDVVRRRAPPRVSARDGYLNMLVVEAIMRSMQQRRVVEIHDATDRGLANNRAYAKPTAN
ncbi:MAG: Gfo/Idh/MocA family oxidoreductase [Alphaproteobacteria bacterium]